MAASYVYVVAGDRRCEPEMFTAPAPALFRRERLRADGYDVEAWPYRMHPEPVQLPEGTSLDEFMRSYERSLET